MVQMIDIELNTVELINNFTSRIKQTGIILSK